MRKPDDFRILAEQISKEPLAQLVRATDVDLFDVLRWTIFAMIEAEELGVTSANVAEMVEERQSGRAAAARRHARQRQSAGTGRSLGLQRRQDRRQLRRGLRPKRRDGQPDQAAARRQRVVVRRRPDVRAALTMTSSAMNPIRMIPVRV